jgi:RNA polymerase primary sigma factor
MLAIDKFSLERETRFLTYAEWWIRKEMFDEIHSSSFIHVPTHRQKSLRKEQKEGKYLCVHCGLRTEDPESKEHWTGCTEVDHEFILPLNNDSAVLNDAVSLDDVTLSCDTNVESLVINTDVEEHLRAAIHQMSMSERDRFIIMGYFNVPLPDRKSEPKSLHQLAALTGITPERVRQIKEETLKALRKELKRRAIGSTAEVCV